MQREPALRICSAGVNSLCPSGRVHEESTEKRPVLQCAGSGGNGKNGKRNNKKCRSCGKLGHLEDACWEKASNAGKRPNGWRTSTVNPAAAAISGTSGVEFVLSSIDMSILDIVQGL